MQQKILKNLNSRQQEAVKINKGPLLVIAGAGSGKTRVLTHKVAYLIAGGIPERQILAVTFTNKAASLMKERIKELLKGKVQFQRFKPNFQSEPYVGTFHSFCVQVLRREIGQIGFEDNFVIFDSEDELQAIKKVMKTLGFSKDDINPRAIKASISAAKNELVTPERYLNFAEPGYFTEIVEKVYKEYQKQLKKMKALDFDDLIMFTVRLFKDNPEVLKRYQERFRYILVDEYQDTNKAQYVLINLLSKRYRNICVVGDDWQAIYSFRGADIRNILEFEKDYQDAKVVKLEQNYRSTGNILDSAHYIMENSQQRKDKKLWTENGSGEKVKLHLAYDGYKEANFVVSEILKKANGDVTNLPEAVVLYRTNAQSRVLEEVLMERGIPYRIVGGVKFYERKEIKDMLAYLRLVFNEEDDLAFLRVVNVPARKVGARTILGLEVEAKRHRLSLFKYLDDENRLQKIKGVARKGLIDFRNIILAGQKSIKNVELPELIEFLTKRSGLEKILRDGTEENESRYENIMELKTVAKRYVSGDTKKDLAKFLEDISLISDLDDTSEEAMTKTGRESLKNKVILMTIHSAKGLEFESVFIVGMEESLFPHSRCVFDPKELEEERRLCYVGMTRAKKNLYLIRAIERAIFGSIKQNPPSRFLEEIPEKYLEEVSEYSDLNDKKAPLGEVQYIDFEV